MAHQRNFCICKPWSSAPALSWASLLCPHYVGRTRLFRILRRMSTQVALGVTHAMDTAINTLYLNRNTQHLPHLYGISVQHTQDSQACPNDSECLYAFHRAGAGTHISVCEISVHSVMEMIPSLFSSPSNEIISLITQKPPVPSLQNYHRVCIINLFSS